MQVGQVFAGCQRQAEVSDLVIAEEAGRDQLGQGLDGSWVNRAVKQVAPFNLGVVTVCQVSLVVGGDHWQVLDADFVQDFQSGLDHLIHIRVSSVNDIDQEVSILSFLQGCLERVDQLVGELGDKADGVGQDKGEAVQVNPADRGVQGRKEHVFGHDLLVFIAGPKGLKQAIHGGGLAGVGVADQGDLRQVTLVAAGSLDFFLAGDFL